MTEQGVSIKPDASEVVVGDKANKLHFFSIAGDALSAGKVRMSPGGGGLI